MRCEGRGRGRDCESRRWKSEANASLQRGEREFTRRALQIATCRGEIPSRLTPRIVARRRENFMFRSRTRARAPNETAAREFPRHLNKFAWTSRIKAPAHIGIGVSRSLGGGGRVAFCARARGHVVMAQRKRENEERERDRERECAVIRKRCRGNKLTIYKTR